MKKVQVSSCWDALGKLPKRLSVELCNLPLARFGPLRYTQKQFVRQSVILQ